MSDRDKFVKHEKEDLIKFCKSKGIKTGHCFAKIDFVNTIIEKGYKYSDFPNKRNSKKTKSPQTVSLKTAKIKFPSPLPKAKLKKTATRFCVDADIDQNGELDVAEFILAAKYLGSEVNNDELMDIFMEHVENADDNDENKSNPKEIIKNLMKKVENKYGKYDDDGAITTQETSVYAVNSGDGDIYSEDIEIGANNIDDFLVKQQKEQQLEIARNLMQISTLTRQEIAEMTGVDANDLKQYESDEYDTESESDYETDSSEDDDDNNDNNDNKIVKIDDNKHVKTKSKVKMDSFEGVKIIGNHGKNLLIEKKYCDKLKEIVKNGKNGIKNESQDVIYLLQTLSDAINLAPGAMRRAKTMAKLNLQSMNIPQEKKEPELKLPAKYRIVITPGALVKSHKDRNEATSTIVARLPTGREVIVEEIDGNRVRISSPSNGWCSLKHSKDGRIILERCDIKGKKSKEMQDAIKKDKTHKTQIEILKNVTTLTEKTCIRMLEKCKWNLRLALDSFYIAKFKTQQWEQQKEKKKEKLKNKQKENKQVKRVITTEDMFKDNDDNDNDKKNKGWFKSWKQFANNKNIDDDK